MKCFFFHFPLKQPCCAALRLLRRKWLPARGVGRMWGAPWSLPLAVLHRPTRGSSAARLRDADGALSEGLGLKEPRLGKRGGLVSDQQGSLCLHTATLWD